MEHPKIKLIEEKKQEIKKLEHELYMEQIANAKTLKAQYEQIVIYAQNGNKSLRINSILTNQKIFDDHLHCFRSLVNPPKKEKLSVEYYRKHGLLLHQGGGWLILEDEQPCSDNEWEEIISGNIPKKFLKSKNN